MKQNLNFTVLQSFFVLIASAQQHYLITGTYTSGKSEGIYVYQFNNNNSTSKEISHIKTSNPSYIALSPNQQFIYAVQEDAPNDGTGGKIAAFSFNRQTGNLTYLNAQSSGGDSPCYVSVDKTGKWVAVGNYNGGSLSVLPIRANGRLGKAVTTIKLEGSGPNKARQDKSHVHCTLFSADNHFLFVSDLGTDKLMSYGFDAATGKLTPAKKPFYHAFPGSGPRHICFHPSGKYAYLVEELSGTIETLVYENGSFQLEQSISTMPTGETSEARTADIHISPDGRFLYASNRAEANSIAIYKVNPDNGMLLLAGHQSTLGKTPRNFSLDPSGDHLLVANQNSDEIVIFKRDKETGLLTDTQKRIKVGNPVCLKWIGIK